MKAHLALVPAVAGIMLASATACTSSTGDASEDIIVGTTDQVTASEEAPAPLDPAYAYDISTWNVLRQTVQTLMTQPRADTSPVPDAAKECRFTDTNNRRYSCTLRDNLKFASGDPITSDDVKFSIDRSISIKADSGVFSLLSTVKAVETQGKRTVIFHLNTPDATFPLKLTTPVAGIVNPSNYKPHSLRPGFGVDGSGPYTLSTESKDGSLTRATFRKNPHYIGAQEIRNTKAAIQFFPDTGSMNSALDSGEIDVSTRGMSPQRIASLANSSAGEIRLYESPGLEIRYLSFNTDASSVRNKAVRQAIAQIVDRGELASNVYDYQVDPLHSIVPTQVVTHTNSFFNKYGVPNNVKAKKLLSSAKISLPVRLKLHYTTDHYGPATKKEFEVLQKQLNTSGLFDVAIEGTPWKDFRPAEKSGAYDVYGMGWFPDFPDPDSFVAPFLDKDNTLNSSYVNREIRDVLLPESRREVDRFQASRSLTAIQKITAEDVPILPLWQGKQYVAAREEITGAEYAVNSSATLQLWELGIGLKA
ncbi:ABC transporter substrate-binding protein [Streptomyces sp. NPDC095817]|uniref:ABC transporter substrate-binding protein n=1 Tax=Streptomyces sp. NPDC095817 TaxID=3155082 RepID=UPI0033267F72